MLTPALALAATLATGVSGPWALVPLEGINVHEGHLAAARQVLKDHLASLGQPTVALDAGLADPIAAAREKGAGAVLRGTLTRLGQKVKVNLTLTPLDGAPRTAALDAISPEDLDPVLMRLARHLVKGDPIADANVGEVTEQETDTFKKKKANSYFGLAVTGVLARSGPDTTWLSGGSAYWLYDARSFFADIQFTLGFAQGRTHGQTVGLTVAMLHPLSDKDVTPYVGGGAGFGTVEVGGDGGSGLMVFADGGVLYGRTSSVHLRADLRPFLTTYRLHDRVTDAQGALAWGALFSVGVGY